jgi:hypothetical protein
MKSVKKCGVAVAGGGSGIKVWHGSGGGGSGKSVAWQSGRVAVKVKV